MIAKQEDVKANGERVPFGEGVQRDAWPGRRARRARTFERAHGLRMNGSGARARERERAQILGGNAARLLGLAV